MTSLEDGKKRKKIVQNAFCHMSIGTHVVKKNLVLGVLFVLKFAYFCMEMLHL